MKNIIKISVIIITLISTLFTPVSQAHAGILDWFTAKDEATNDVSINYLDATDVAALIQLGNKNSDADTTTVVQKNSIIQSNSPVKTIEKKTVYKEYVVHATGYSSTPDQTDDSPFITARGTKVRDGIIATNFLPFGTKVKIPGMYGNKIFVVEDRMNKRYTTRIDIWFADRQSALNFGLRTVKIQVVES